MFQQHEISKESYNSSFPAFSRCLSAHECLQQFICSSVMNVTVVVPDNNADMAGIQSLFNSNLNHVLSPQPKCGTLQGDRSPVLGPVNRPLDLRPHVTFVYKPRFDCNWAPETQNNQIHKKVHFSTPA